MAEFIMNGIVEEETGRYYHVCFFGDKGGQRAEELDHYVFVPKQVCTVTGRSNLAIQDWYVHKHKLTQFVKQQPAASVRIDRNTQRIKRMPAIQPSKSKHGL